VAVLSYREVLPRSYEHKLGGNPTASMVFVATLDGTTDASAVIGEIGISHGSLHPDHAALACDGISAEDIDRFHTQVTYTFTVTDGKDGDGENPPWSQPDTWHFGTTNASVACTKHYVGNGNANRVTLANTAGDPIFGIAMAESELKITISGSRLEFDLATALQYVNSINDDVWAGFPKHTVQCVGVSAQPAALEWEGEKIDYWQINVELLYRSSSHNLILPNVGWRVIVNGKKERAWTYITEGGERKKVPSTSPVSLNMDGGYLCGPGDDEGRNPDGGTAYQDDGTEYWGS
jgi:hypothetical protein